MMQLDLPLEGGGDADALPPTTPAPTPTRTRLRGFAAMHPTKVREIASKGGRAAHASGNAHQFTSDEARAAGRKGGIAPHVSRGRRRRSP